MSPFENLIRRDALVAACQAVIRIPSETGQEAAVARFVVKLMTDLGFDEARIDQNGNVLGRIRGTGSGASVMLNGHIDHVPAGDMEDPFGATIEDAAQWGENGLAIRGRGSCDMKCNVISAIFAAAAVREAGLNTGGDILVVADVEEETDSPNGVKSVVAGGMRADYGISVESTNGGIYLGHRGKVEFELVVRGRTSHASEPGRGINAVTEAMRYLAAFEAYAKTLPTDPLMGEASAVAVSIRSYPDNGTAVVPDRCVLRLDRRYVRGETPESVEAGLRAALDAVTPAIERPWMLTLFNHYPLMYVEKNNPVVQAAITAMEAATPGPARVSAWRFGVNGTFMAEAGIPTVGLGPGNETWAHTPDEHILIDDLVETTKILARTLVTISHHEPGR